MIKRTRIIVTLTIPIICGLAVIFLGKDINWDLHNYHYYNAFAFVNHRLEFDIAPAQLQTFYNPLLDLPFFFMTKYLQTLPHSSMIIGVALGGIQGINLVLVFLIFCNASSFALQTQQIEVGFFVLFISGFAPGFISELGGVMNDNIVSIFVLYAIFFTLIAYDYFEQKKINSSILLLSISGFIMGISVGLKPTAASYAIGSAVALMVLFSTWQDRTRYILWYIVAGMIGGIVSGGFWWLKLWSTFGNPLLPYFNNIFQSPYVQAVAFTDRRFLPDDIWEYFVWPILFSWDSQRVAELQFRDIRFAIVFITYLVYGVRTIFNSKNGQQNFHDRKFKFLATFFGLSFVAWMIMSSIYRYLIGLELLIPIIFLGLIERIVTYIRMRTIITIIVIIIISIVFRPLNWGRDVWSNPYINVKTNQLVEQTQNSIVIMLGWSPTSYVIPYFPSTARFIRPDGNLMLLDEDILYQNIQEIVEHQKTTGGKIFLLFDEKDKKVNLEASSIQLGLDLNQLECLLVRNNQQQRLMLCKVLK